MAWDEIKGNWTMMKGMARQRWGELSDDDVELMKGERDELVGKIQMRYGKTKEDAEQEVDDWVESVRP